MGKEVHQPYIWKMDDIQNLQRIQEVRHQQPNIPVKKWSTELHRESSTEESQMAMKH